MLRCSPMLPDFSSDKDKAREADAIEKGGQIPHKQKRDVGEYALVE